MCCFNDCSACIKWNRKFTDLRMNGIPLCFQLQASLHKSNKEQDRWQISSSSLVIFFYVWNITKVLGRLRKVVCYYTKERLTLNRIFCFYSRSVTQSAITSASRRYDVVIQLLVEVARSRGQGVPNGSRDPSRRRQAGRRADVSYSAHMDSGRTMWCGPRWPVTIGQSNLLEMPLINTRHALLLLSSPPTHCRSPYRPMS